MSGFSMFMLEGGFGMYPILVFGLTCLGAGVRFAVRPNARWLAFTGAMWLTVLTTALHATVLDLGQVFAYFGRKGVEPDQFTRLLFTGLKESSRPLALAGIFLTLAVLAVAVGALRSRWNET